MVALVGPSFLGLNSQPENNSDVEYLLEDQPSGSGLRKVLLLLVLVAILGLLFMQWRSSLKASPNRRRRQNQIHRLQPMRRREITNLLVPLCPPLLKRLKPQPTEPILLGLALLPLS